MNEIILGTIEQVGKLKENQCRVTTCEYIFFSELNCRLKFFAETSPILKARTYADIVTTLKPDFIVSNHLTLNDNDLYNYMYNKALRMLSNRARNNYKKTFNLRENVTDIEAFKIVKLRIQQYLDENLNVNSVNEKIKIILQMDQIELKDLINNNYVISFTRQVYFSDTTHLAENCELTLIIDGCSRVIVYFFVTELPPNTQELLYYLNIFFTNDLVRRCRIFHTDRCGSFTGLVVKNFFSQKKISRSYTQTKYKNQVAEAVNGSIKKIIKSHQFEDLKGFTPFNNLNKGMQSYLIKFAVNKYNNSYFFMGTIKHKLNKYTRNYIDAAFEFLYIMTSKQINNVFLLAERTNELGTNIYNWMFLVVKSFEISLNQTKLSNHFGINYCCINKIELNILVKMLEDNFYGMSIMEENLNRYTIEINNLIKEGLMLKSKGFNLEDIINRLKLSLLEKFEKTTSKEEKERVIAQIGWIFFGEAKTKEQAIKFRQIMNQFQSSQEKFNQIIQEKKEFEEALKNVTTRLEQKSINKENYNIRKIYNKSIKSCLCYSVMPEDFPIILEIAEKEKDEFTAAKYILAIVILIITGIRIGNLIYVNFDQLDNLYNKRTMYLKRIKTQESKPLVFPYTKAMNKYLNPTRKYYEYMKKCQENNHPRLYTNEIYKNSTNENFKTRSEIWGFASRTIFGKKLSKILKLAGRTLKKCLSGNSFRRGIGILISRTLGIKVARQILGYSNVGSTETYTTRMSCETNIRTHLETIHNIKNSRYYVDYLIYKEEEESEIVHELEADLKGEQWHGVITLRGDINNNLEKYD